MHIDPFFLSWLCELVSDDFQRYFIVEEVPPTQNDIIMEYQNCINSPEESPNSDVEKIAINIAGIVLHPTDR